MPSSQEKLTFTILLLDKISQPAKGIESAVFEGAISPSNQAKKQHDSTAKSCQEAGNAENETFSASHCLKYP